MVLSSGILFALLSVVASSNGLSRVSRAAGGIPGDIEQLPYVVAIKYDNRLVCGGAIISPTKILTAASCLLCSRTKSVRIEDCVKSMTIVAGSANIESGNVYRVEEAKIPQNFIAGKFANDLGVITLKSGIEFSTTVKSIDLPNEDIVEGIIGVTGGWGAESESSKPSNFMKSIKENIITNEKCNEIISKNSTITVDVNDFCAIPVDGADKAGLCAGDSGNPLAYNGKVIGISSWGIGCAKGFPDVFSNVYRQINFIKSQL